MSAKTIPLTDDVGESIQIIGKHRLLFAHHSVGNNILDGLRSIAKETGHQIDFTNPRSTSISGSSTFVEFSPGKNTDPKSKIDGFAAQINMLHPEFIPEAAFLKFCYIDFAPDTKVEDIFNHYKNQIETLRTQFPDIQFIHFTVPLTIRPDDLKSRARRLLRMQVWGDASNISRCNYNELLRKYFPADQIFDIARIESTRPDGGRVAFSHMGRMYYSLAPEYTDDGGHLNQLGQRIVASELAKVLANILK